MDHPVLRGRMAVIVGVLDATRELLIRCDDYDDVPVCLQPPEKCARQLSL